MHNIDTVVDRYLFTRNNVDTAIATRDYIHVGAHTQRYDTQKFMTAYNIYMKSPNNLMNHTSFYKMS